MGTVHTIIGPDHYVPFLALARAGGWPLRKTLAITLACGVGHVLSSVVIGLIGVAAGLAVAEVTEVEEARGSIATWALIGFGLAYGAWGLWRGIRGRQHVHAHVHADGSVHAHRHGHEAAHAHPHPAPGRSERAVWVLFIVFVLGPCEPLIPILMYPAATHSWGWLGVVTAVFGGATILTMTVMVTAGWLGARALRAAWMERFIHALAGGVLALSGLTVVLLDV
jgi:ABC-type nickel/cobalt efflux system permease component RcnA